MVTFRGSKTDQFNLGCTCYVGRTGNSRCAIAAFHEWEEELQPGHFRPENGDSPMFTLPSGHVLGRSEMQNDFRLATQALDLPTEHISSTHSCRVSCGTWLYQAGYYYVIEYIKRHARWRGNSVHVYLWEGSGLHSMVKDMSEVKFKLHLHIAQMGFNWELWNATSSSVGARERTSRGLGFGLLLWATGSGLRLLRWWRSLLGILPCFVYYCSHNARSALETGRPATSGNRRSIPMDR